MSRRPARVGALAVILASVLWGTTGTAATFAPGVGPLAVGAAAMGIGGILQALVAARAIHAARRRLAADGRILALGVGAVVVYPLAFYSSMHLAGVAVGTVVSIGSAPLAAAVIERVADSHPLTVRWGIAAAAGVGGAALLAAAEAGSGTSRDLPGMVLGIALGLVAGVTYALYSWVAHRLMEQGVPSGAAMGSMFGVAGIILLPVLVATGGPLVASWTNLGVAAYLALVPMFAGYVLFGVGLARVRASTATLLSLVEPVVAAVLAVLVVGEDLGALGWVGIGLVLGSLVVLSVPPGTTRPSRAEGVSVHVLTDDRSATP